LRIKLAEQAYKDTQANTIQKHIGEYEKVIEEAINE